MIVVTVTPFSGTTTPDKNNNMPVMLQCIAGKMPNRNVLSGTVAGRLGIEIGKSYLMQVRETGFDKFYGADFTFIRVKELITAKDVIDACESLGKPQIINIPRPEGFEKVYERKGDVVEGLRTKRAKAGEYEFALNRDVSHETAREIKTGTSNEGDQVNYTSKDLKTGIPDDKDIVNK